MEKKNTILLTVIAIATLLVAVVGATFAYFTASVTTSGNETNDSVTTKSLASATVVVGDAISEDSAYPGFSALRTVEITGAGSADSTALTGKIVIDPTVATAFDAGQHVSVTVYKTTAAKDESAVCTNTDGQGTDASGNTTYYTTSSCTLPATKTEAVAKTVITSSSSNIEVPVTIAYNTVETYYIVLEYENVTTADQNSEQGSSIELNIDYVQTAS